MNQIINMIMRQVMRKFITKGIDKGFDHFSRNSKIDPNSAEGKQADVNAKGAAKTAKQTMQMVRRLGRF
jgi:hypothetical protein